MSTEHWPREAQDDPRHHHPRRWRQAWAAARRHLKNCVQNGLRKRFQRPPAAGSATPGRAGMGLATAKLIHSKPANCTKREDPPSTGAAPGRNQRIHPSDGHVFSVLPSIGQMWESGLHRVRESPDKVRSVRRMLLSCCPAFAHNRRHGSPARRPEKALLHRYAMGWISNPPAEGLCTRHLLRSGVRERRALWSISCSPLSRRIPLSRYGAIARAGSSVPHRISDRRFIYKLEDAEDGRPWTQSLPRREITFKLPRRPHEPPGHYSMEIVITWRRWRRCQMDR